MSNCSVPSSVIARLNRLAADLASGEEAFTKDEIYTDEEGKEHYPHPVDAAISRELESLVGKAVSDLSAEKLRERIETALDLARQIPKSSSLAESANHRSWVIDNIVRELTRPVYDSFVQVACCSERCDEDGNAVVPYVIKPDSYKWYVGKEARNHNTVNAPSVELKPASVNDLKERIVDAAITGAFGQGTADHHLAKRIDDIVLTLADTQYAAAIRDQPQWYKGIQA